jgi:hypothetical protein
MHEELIQLIQEIQTNKKSGLLMAVVKISTQAEVEKGITALTDQPDISFFFKDGILASVISRGIRGGSVESKISAIALITRTQWTATNSSTISVTDKAFGADQLLELLGAKKIEKSALDISKDHARMAIGLALEARGAQVFLQVFGRNGSTALKAIRQRFDPCIDPEEFTKACVAKLAPLIGLDSARSLIG